MDKNINNINTNTDTELLDVGLIKKQKGIDIGIQYV